jgi:hypothetical protein
MRNIKTEYVSCPSCGRTLFDLQEVTEQIRVRTGHLPGVAIAIMGCIVNGPGEMADADFGYVGGAPGGCAGAGVCGRDGGGRHGAGRLRSLRSRAAGGWRSCGAFFAAGAPARGARAQRLPACL